jgi:DNA-binding MarR family transcriptional regulator
MNVQLIPAIHRATHAIALQLESPPKLAVTQAEAHVLAHLVTEGDSTVAEIHRAFGHKRSTLTAILDRLEARGLIGRRTSEADRRSFLVSLTTRGERIGKVVCERLASIEGAMLARLSAGERKAVRSALAILGDMGEGDPRAK